MEKTHTLTDILMNIERAKEHVRAVMMDNPGNKHRFGMIYWKRAMEAAERSERFWIKKLQDFGKAKMLEVSGDILIYSPENEIYIRKSFKLVMVGVKEEDVIKYLSAQANGGTDRILLDTIKLKESQTGTLIIT